MRYIVLLGILFLSACSIFDKDDLIKPAELVKFSPTVKLHTVWSKDVSSGQSAGYTRLSPAISVDTLFAIDHTGDLVALNRSTGKTLWKKNIQESISAGVGISGDVLLLGNGDGEIIALSSMDGEELWRTQLTGEILSTPVGDGSMVAVQTLDEKLNVLDAASGEILWFYESVSPKLTLRGRPQPILTASGLYAGFANGRFMAFNPKNGLILWEQRIALPQGRSDLAKMVDIHASPVMRDGIIYVSGFQGRLMAISRVTGRPLWGVDSSSYQELLLTGSMLIVSSEDSKVTAYNANSGELIWQSEQLLHRRITGAALISSYLAIADEEGYLHILDSVDGSFVARGKVDGSGVRAALINDGELLYAFANDGTLKAYEINE